MHVLIIDNGTSYIKLLKALIKPNQASVIKFEDLKSIDINSYDLVILSGGHSYPVEHYHNLYEQEIKAILRADIPILGICLGFELIVYAFGGRLAELQKKEKGIVEVKTIKNDPIIGRLNTIRVYESHRWVAKDLPKELISLAISKDGIEIVRHITRPIYGFQFHPEVIVDVKDLEIFKNAIKLSLSGY